MATHSGILAWRIPGTGRLVGYDPQGDKKLDMTEATQNVCEGDTSPLSPERPSLDQAFGTFSPISQLPQKGERLETGLITKSQECNQSCLCNETSIKNPKRWGSGSFRVGEDMELLGEWHTQRGHGISTSPLPYLTYLTLTHLFLSHNLYNKLVSKVHSQVLRVMLPNYQI